MIRYEWRTELTPEESSELAGMLERAAAYDAEPEYSTIDFASVSAALEQQDPRIQHLVIWMLPHATAMAAPDEPERIAGLLRLEVHEDGSATASLVVDPKLRSIGITTLLVEQVGLDLSGPGGWLDTGVRSVRSWARGNHPASGRLSDRFLIPRTRRIWKLIRPTDSIHSAAAAPALEALERPAIEDDSWAAGLGAGSMYGLREAGVLVALVAMDCQPTLSEEFGSCATATGVRCDPAADPIVLRRVLDGAAGIAQEKGFTGLIVHVESSDSRLVNACRLVGFQHDRTDVQYQLGEAQ